MNIAYPNILHRVRSLVRGAQVIYFGATSYDIRDRLDAPKRAWGVTHIIELYRTKSKHYTKKTERKLIAEYWGDQRLANDKPGGEGIVKIDCGEEYSVYVALRC